MNHDLDSFESALSSLKSVQWDGPSYDPKLEEKLMHQFSRQSGSVHPRRRTAWIASLAVLVVGGGAFAAGGGIEMLRSLFFTVDIQGRQVQVELQPVDETTHEGALSTQLDDGRQADIRVRHVQQDPNHRQVEVRAVVNDGEDGSDQAEEHASMRQKMLALSDSSESLTMDDLAGSTPTRVWKNSEGEDRSLYLITDEDAGLLKVVTVTWKLDGTQTVRLLTKLPSAMFQGTPIIEDDGNGGLTLTWDDGGGAKRRVIKLRERTQEEKVAPGDVDLPGNIKIRVNPDE